MQRIALLVGLVVLSLVIGAPPTTVHASGNWNKTGSMNVARINHTATLLQNGEVLVAGGTNSTAYLASAELYNPATGKWTFTGNMVTGRWNHQAVRLQNSQVLAAGGFDTSGNITASAELYNPASGTWTATGNMTTPRQSFALVALANAEVLAAGGTGAIGGLSSAELYNPATGTWMATGSMPSGSECGGSVTLLPNGQAFVLCGGAGSLYNPATGSWTATPQAPFGGGAPIALLQSGQVWDRGDMLFTPSTGQWTTFNPPACACLANAATLQTGKVLGAGGETGTFGYSNFDTSKAAALWDPATLAWTSTGNMTQSRTEESMTVLLNGQALVAGGQTFDKSLNRLVTIATADLYTP